ncbi:hypothetical protein [Gemmatimonas sp.]
MFRTPRVSVFGATSPDQFHGVGMEVTFDIRGLYDKALAESQIDGARWSMSDDATMRMSMAAIADGWQGPLNLRAYHPSLWIFEESDLAPAVDFLARRVREMVIPTLAQLTSLRSVCDALDTRPLTASPFFKGWTNYSVPLLFEMCGHPSLHSVVAEMDAFWTQQPRDTWGTSEMQAFLTRVRQRNGLR